MAATDFIEPYFIPPMQKYYFNQEMMGKYEPLANAMWRVQETGGLDDESWENFCFHYEKFRNFEAFNTWDGNKYDIVFYGVSGYTGYLMMEYLKRTALKVNPEEFTFAFAGRTPYKVQDMRDREFAGTQWEDTPIIQASYSDYLSIIDLVKSARVIVNVAGPYMLTEGECMLDACIHMGVHYVDISGEIPWSRRVSELHSSARAAGVCICPSAATAGCYPDMATYVMSKQLRENYGEETRKAVVYCSGGGSAAGSSGGTLKTRGAMSAAGDEVRRAMADPFSLGGFIPQFDRNGFKVVNIEYGTGIVTPKTRQEDLDANMSKITEDKHLGVWRGPFTYSYFDTRIVRRSNALFADHDNQPYGLNLNFLEYGLIKPEAFFQAPAPEQEGEKKSVGLGTSVEEEKARLQAAGKYFKEGEGPPLEDLDDAYITQLCWAQSTGGQETKVAFLGRDGYFETARAAVETAMTFRFDMDQIRATCGNRGGFVTATFAGTTFLMQRLITSGMSFKTGDWFSDEELKPPPYP